MYTGRGKMFWKLLLVTLLVGTLNAAGAENAGGNFKVVDGVAIYLGLMPAPVLQGHPGKHTERQMHGGVPKGRNQKHLLVALFDDASGKRIEDAQVSVVVSELVMGRQRKRLEPMEIAGAMTYGNYFNMPGDGKYSIQLHIQRPGGQAAIEATFTHE